MVVGYHHFRTPPYNVLYNYHDRYTSLFHDVDIFRSEWLSFFDSPDQHWQMVSKVQNLCEIPSKNGWFNRDSLKTASHTHTLQITGQFNSRCKQHNIRVLVTAQIQNICQIRSLSQMVDLHKQNSIETPRVKFFTPLKPYKTSTFSASFCAYVGFPAPNFLLGKPHLCSILLFHIG